jgi:hypothetical protein
MPAAAMSVANIPNDNDRALIRLYYRGKNTRRSKKIPDRALRAIEHAQLLAVG